MDDIELQTVGAFADEFADVDVINVSIVEMEETMEPTDTFRWSRDPVTMVYNRLVDLETDEAPVKYQQLPTPAPTPTPTPTPTAINTSRASKCTRLRQRVRAPLDRAREKEAKKQRKAELDATRAACFDQEMAVGKRIYAVVALVARLQQISYEAAIAQLPPPIQKVIKRAETARRMYQDYSAWSHRAQVNELPSWWLEKKEDEGVPMKEDE